MVIPSLIYKALNQKNLTVWGNGTPIRDFIFEDVAEAMLNIVYKKFMSQ